MKTKENILDQTGNEIAGRKPAIAVGGLDSALGFLLLAAWREASIDFTKHFAEFDITQPAYGVLLLIKMNPGIEIAPICEIMGISPNNMTKIIDRLVNRGLIKRSISPRDRRARTLSLTKKGDGLIISLEKRHSLYEAEFHSSIGDELATALRALLQILVKNRNLTQTGLEERGRLMDQGDLLE